MLFELCIPAYNEAAIIQQSLTRIVDALSKTGTVVWRIVVADNASTDGTGDRVRSFSDSRVSVMRVEKKGKGSAIVEAAQKSMSGLFGFIDADLSADPADIIAMLAVLTRGDADIVIGSRLLDTHLVRRGALRTASSRAFNTLRRMLLGVKVSDSQCGLKVMNARARKVLCSCIETGWFLDMEFLARTERAGLRIQEVPVHWDEWRFANRASKLRILRDGFGALVAMVRIRNRLG